MHLCFCVMWEGECNCKRERSDYYESETSYIHCTLFRECLKSLIYEGLAFYCHSRWEWGKINLVLAHRITTQYKIDDDRLAMPKITNFQLQIRNFI